MRVLPVDRQKSLLGPFVNNAFTHKSFHVLLIFTFFFSLQVGAAEDSAVAEAAVVVAAPVAGAAVVDVVVVVAGVRRMFVCSDFFSFLHKLFALP